MLLKLGANYLPYKRLNNAPRKSKKLYCDPEKDAGNPMASSTSEDTEEGVVKCIVGKKSPEVTHTIR